MTKLFANRLFQAVLVFFAVIGVYTVYMQLTFTPPSINIDGSVADRMSETMNEMTDEMESATTEQNRYAGLHIMANGAVMLGNGEVLDDATITPEGMVRLPDGTLLTPAMDMRP